MTDIPARYVRLAAFVTHQEIHRRQLFGHPIPQSLRDLDRVLHAAILAEPGQHARQSPGEPTQSAETVTQRAHRLGISPRSLRRHAHSYGGRKVGTQWTFPLE